MGILLLFQWNSTNWSLHIMHDMVILERPIVYNIEHIIISSPNEKYNTHSLTFHLINTHVHTTEFSRKLYNFLKKGELRQEWPTDDIALFKAFKVMQQSKLFWPIWSKRKNTMKKRKRKQEDMNIQKYILTVPQTSSSDAVCMSVPFCMCFSVVSVLLCTLLIFCVHLCAP